MQTTNLNVNDNAIVNPVIAPKKDAKKKTENLQKINLSKFADKLKDVKEQILNSAKSTIYNYPEILTPLDIKGKLGKQFRSKQRNKIEKFANNITVFAKFNKLEDLKNEIKNFDINYKENYKINDYSLQSISQSSDETNKSYLTLMLDIIKEIKKESKPITNKKK
jgi:hypothetical protein